jgi:catechol 2,3-dioxygenase-like lactoylglutathione lyase family enzyme
MIKGLHVTYYTRHADEMRSFMRDKLGLAFTDVGEGWLIFDVPGCEIAAHPVDGEGSESAEEPEPGLAEISFYCDDIHETMRTLKEKGVEFTSEVSDEGWGLLVSFRMAPDVEVDLYQPRYERNPTRG